MQLCSSLRAATWAASTWISSRIVSIPLHLTARLVALLRPFVVHHGCALELLAPALSFTAEEAYAVFNPENKDTIFVERYAELPNVKEGVELSTSGPSSEIFVRTFRWKSNVSVKKV